MNDTRPTPVGSLDDGVRLACDRVADLWESTNQALRVGGILERFVSFARAGFGVEDAEFVTAEIAAAFVRSNFPDGSRPSVSLLHLRRSALRLLFRSLRVAGATVGDPTLDLVLPPRHQPTAPSNRSTQQCRRQSLPD